MTVNIESSASSISKSLDSCNAPSLIMHRIWFHLHSAEEWYKIMKEANKMFGTNWRTQSKVKRKLEHNIMWGPRSNTVPVWFEVPDQAFATWVAIKHAVITMVPTGK